MFTTPSPIMIMATSRPGQLNHDRKMFTGHHYNSRPILQSHSKDKLLVSFLNMLSTAEARHHEPVGSKVPHSSKKTKQLKLPVFTIRDGKSTFTSKRPFNAYDDSPCNGTTAEENNIIETLTGINTSRSSTCGSTSTSKGTS